MTADEVVAVNQEREHEAEGPDGVLQRLVLSLRRLPQSTRISLNRSDWGLLDQELQISEPELALAVVALLGGAAPGALDDRSFGGG
jgi:hypothetical protein